MRVGISVAARADILPVDDVMGKLREVAGEEAAAYIDALDLGSLQEGQSLADIVQENVAVFSKAYAELVKFVEKQEDKMVVEKGRVGPVTPGTASGGVSSSGSPAPIAGGAVSGGGAALQPGKRSFDGDMVFSVRRRGEEEPECAWVRRDNEKKWQNGESPSAPATPGLAPIPAP